MGIFDNDRPEGFKESDDSGPAIHLEKLPPREKLAMDAEDIEEFAEHYDQEGEPLSGESSAP